MKEKRISIGITDDQPLFRKGLIALVNSFDEMQVIIEANNGRDLLEKLSHVDSRPDVLLIDLKMPEMDGIETTKQIRKVYPEIKIVILTIYNEDRFILHLLECGAHAYVFKDAEPDELKKAIISVYNEGFYFTTKIISALHNQQKKRNHFNDLDSELTVLTEREKEVLKLICKELTSEEIGNILFISPRTVEGHRNNLLLKTGSKNLAGLVIYAMKNNLVDIVL